MIGHDASELDEICNKLWNDAYGKLGAYTFDGTGTDTLTKMQAKQAILALKAEWEREAFQQGLLTGAMPEFIGKPMVLEYLTARPQPLNNKGDE